MKIANEYSARLFAPSDDEYAAIAAIYSSLWPDERQHPAAMWRENDEQWPSDALLQRFVVEYDGRIAGMGSCYEKYWQHKPGTVQIEFHIHPGHANRGVDELLYATILDFLGRQSLAPKVIATEAREDRIERTGFLLERGFQPVMRSPAASLNVAEFDAARFQGLDEKIAANGIRIETLSEQIEKDPDWRQKLYDLRWAIIQDVPSVEPATRLSFSEFEDMILDDPALDGAAWFIALTEPKRISDKGAIFVGMCNLWLNDPTNKRLDTGLTGVLKDYRRLGIATALKVRTVEFGQKVGAQTIEAKNEEHNPMYDLNMKLGFQPKAAWLSFRKSIELT